MVAGRWHCRSRAVPRRAERCAGAARRRRCVLPTEHLARAVRLVARRSDACRPARRDQRHRRGMRNRRCLMRDADAARRSDSRWPMRSSHSSSIAICAPVSVPPLAGGPVRSAMPRVRCAAFIKCCPPSRPPETMPPRPRLRLAMLSYGLPVEGQKRGGIERAAHTLADGLARRNHDVVVFSHDPKPSGAAYEVRELPWKSFVNTWAGRRLTMGYLGNVLALVPDYREFDAVIAHGDSLLIPLTGKPVLRVMHGSALGEARSATSIGRCVLQLWRLWTRAADGVRKPRRRRGQREHHSRQSLRGPRHSAWRGRQHLHAVADCQEPRAIGAVRRCARRPQARTIPARRVPEDRPSRASRRVAHDRRRHGSRRIQA